MKKKVSKKVSAQEQMQNFNVDCIEALDKLAKKNDVSLEEAIKEAFMLFGHLIAKQDGPRALYAATYSMVQAAFSGTVMLRDGEYRCAMCDMLTTVGDMCKIKTDGKFHTMKVCPDCQHDHKLKPVKRA